MRINFNRIEIHSFMSFEDEVFDFSSMTGMTLVQGKNNDVPNLKNGTGKSTLFMSLLYALFGQLQNKIRNENIVNRYAADKDTRVVLNLDVDGTSYRIVRGIQKGKTSYLNVYQLLSSEEKDITQSTIAETQSYIEQHIIHCDITIFMRTILLSADQTYNFYTLKKSDKKEFVEKLFDISQFEDMYQAIHKDKLVIDKQLISSQNQLLVFNKNVEDYKNRLDSYDVENANNISEATSSLATLTKQLSHLKDNVVVANTEQVQKIDDAMAKLENSMAENNIKWRELVSQSTKLASAKAKLEAEIAAKNSIINKHSDIEQKLCNDCKKIFGDYYNLNSIRQLVDNYASKIKKIDLAIDKNKENEQSITGLISKIKQKMALAKEKKSGLMSEQLKYTQHVATVENNIMMCKNKIQQLQNTENPYRNMLEQAKKDVDSIQHQIESNTIKHQYLEFAENVVSQDTLRKFIIKDLIVLLNNRIKTYLTRLGAKYYVEFDADMDYDFIVPDGTCEFGNFSAGERMRLMIATSLAFRDFMSIRNGLNANILILDEYFDSAIDSVCIESMLKILEEYKNTMNQNIFVISHRLEVNLDQFDRTLVVEKTNNISKIRL